MNVTASAPIYCFYPNLSVEEDWSPQPEQLPFAGMPVIGFIDGLPIVDRYDAAARRVEERRLQAIAEQLGLDGQAYALTEEFVAVTDEDEMPICYVQKLSLALSPDAASLVERARAA